MYKRQYVGCDARQSGTYQGEEILETETKGDINGDGKVSYIMIQGDPENVDAQYRTEFSVKALTDAGVEVEELLKQRGDWDQAKAQQIAQDALNQYGDKIEVIFCNNDAMALGALQAIEAAGRKVNEDIYLVGVDALDVYKRQDHRCAGRLCECDPVQRTDPFIERHALHRGRRKKRWKQRSSGNLQRFAIWDKIKRGQNT